jgi:hypothetical protein
VLWKALCFAGEKKKNNTLFGNPKIVNEWSSQSTDLFLPHNKISLSGKIDYRES